MKFDVSFYWFSSWEFCHISDSTAMSGKTNGIAKQNWFRHFSTKPFTLEIPLNQLLNVIAFSGCFKHLSQNEYMIYNYTTSRKEPHSSHSCNSLEFVALPNLPYCIFFLYFCYLTGRIQYYIMTCSISCLEGVMCFDVTRAIWNFHTNSVLAFILRESRLLHVP